ncbi:MAG: DUF6508 domain-containing protein [Methanobacteriaceae archaeon]|nr:DUF6508 domain-containing protein [Methanobacteriaceae archaeon]MDP2835732.1 DUF6508 domain-containing protein [Methanobacteriaceae archaeon]MDP3035848.1 DUF6508 domain-containing protein [Methanobacteriaceae archaeon]MDP3486110.1 DUF6508 domain-containing protein [Methanobacteriaceae archaeon]MDP3622714.1 DUF6508 domain-containing protein [Methanobacteriaceae archaeon]
MSNPSIENINAILEYIPYFESLKNEIYEINPEKSLMDPHFCSEKTSEFIQAIYENNFIQAFDWSQFNTLKNVENIEHTDIDTLVKILTAYIRANRFSSGSVANFYQRKLSFKNFISFKRN